MTPREQELRIAVQGAFRNLGSQMADITAALERASEAFKNFRCPEEIADRLRGGLLALRAKHDDTGQEPR